MGRILPGGVSDHGLLTGLSDDDHTQYVLRSILTTDGDLFSRSGGSITRIAAVASGQVLASAGVGTLPAWSASPTLTGLTLSGLTASRLVYANASSALTASTVYTDGTSFSFGDTTLNATIRAVGAGNAIFRGINSSGTERFTVGADGEISISVGAGITFPLDVTTNENAQTTLRFRNTNAGASTAIRFLFQTSGGGDSLIQLGGSGNEWALGKDNTDDSFAIATTAGDPILGTHNVFLLSTGGVMSLYNGTAPSGGVADTVQYYSSDDAAGHTIPSFYCEGTNVLATGQADSTSSVRVKMRVNGTVVTLLAV